MKRKVCVVSGSRCEYGLLHWLMKEIQKDDDLELKVVVTGMHLLPEFGLTYKQIEEDGFFIDEKIDISLGLDTAAGVSRSMGLALIGFGECYERIKPDIIVVLGDRFEIFAAVSAALVARIPVAHLNGGELTEGSMDDSFRHAITKMSHIHFTAIEEYRQRVIQLGESPERVFNVGEAGLDNIRRLTFLSKNDLERSLNFKLNKKNIVVTFHPVTLEKDTAASQFQEILKVIDELDETGIFFTKPNADPGNKVIASMIDAYVSKNSSKAIAFTSLGQLRYLSLLQYVDAVVGNSSSGLVEAPSFKIGTINIGDRQKGRVRAESVIDCEPTKEAIEGAFRKLYSKEFQQHLKGVKNPYGDGRSSAKIKEIIKQFDLDNIIKKKFYDFKR